MFKRKNAFIRTRNNDDRIFRFIEWFFNNIFPALFIIMLIVFVVMFVGQFVVGYVLVTEIQENGLKSVIDTLWNGTK